MAIEQASYFIRCYFSLSLSLFHSFLPLFTRIKQFEIQPFLHEISV